jgi:hypothetical protein
LLAQPTKGPTPCRLLLTFLYHTVQYLHVWRDAAVLLGGPLLGVGLVCWVLTASLWGAALLLVVLTSLLVHLMGAMLIAGEWGGGRT